MLCVRVCMWCGWGGGISQFPFSIIFCFGSCAVSLWPLALRSFSIIGLGAPCFVLNDLQTLKLVHCVRIPAEIQRYYR